MTPSEIRLSRDRTRLSITWADGKTIDYPATFLRERTRDANSVRFAVDGWAVPAASGLTISKVEPIGNYAVRLGFSDGHDRGIFPWAYLTEIAASTSRPSAA
jgi:DUF971 family protein